MHIRMRKLLPLALLFLLLPSLAWAADAVPSPDGDAAGWVRLLYTAFTAKEWGVLSGLVLIGLVYPLRRFGPDLFRTQLGGIALAFIVSLLATFGAALAAGVQIGLSLAITALATAATAAGVWEWLKAHLPGVQVAASRVR